MWPAVGMAMAGKAPSPGAFALGQASAKQAQEWQEHFYQNRFKWMMNDMRQSGLNPILAYREAGPGTPSGGGQSVHGGSADFGGASSAVRTRELLSLDKREAEARILESEARAASARSTAAETDARTVLLTEGRAPVNSPLHEIQRDVIDYLKSSDLGGPGQPMIREGSPLSRFLPWAKEQLTETANQFRSLDRPQINLLQKMRDAGDSGGWSARKVLDAVKKWFTQGPGGPTRFQKDVRSQRYESGRWEKNSRGEWERKR